MALVEQGILAIKVECDHDGGFEPLAAQLN